jgi:hypothetical protein
MHLQLLSLGHSEYPSGYRVYLGYTIFVFTCQWLALLKTLGYSGSIASSTLLKGTV